MEQNINYALAIQNTQEKPIKKQPKVKCQENKVAFQVCTKQSCKEASVFICVDPSCMCHVKHKMCLKADIVPMAEILQKKAQVKLKIKQLAEKTINIIVNQINSQKDKMLKIIDEDILQTKLYQIQKNFINMVYQEQESEKKSLSFKSYDSGLLWRIVSSNENNESYIFSQTKRNLTLLKKKYDKALKDFATDFAQKIQLYKKKSQIFLQNKIEQAEQSKKKGKGKEQTETQLDSQENQQNRQQLIQIHKKVTYPNIISDDDERFC